MNFEMVPNVEVVFQEIYYLTALHHGDGVYSRDEDLNVLCCRFRKVSQ